MKTLGPYVLAALLCAGCGRGGDSDGGGGVIIPSVPLDEFVEVGEIGAGLPFGFLQDSTCRIDAAVAAGVFGDEPEQLFVELAFSGNGAAESLEQRFVDLRASNVQLLHERYDFSYDARQRLSRIEQQNLENADGRNETISYAGETSMIASVRSDFVIAGEISRSENDSRVYNNDQRLISYAERLAGRDVALSYFYDKNGRLDNIYVQLDGGIPLPLARLRYSNQGAIDELDLPVFGLCVSATYDDAGMAQSSSVANCGGETLAELSFVGCNAKALAFWVMFVLNAY